MAPKTFDVWPPLGQKPVTPDAIRKERDKLMQGEWPYRSVPTFETWLCMTCYDTDVEGGGALFVKIKKWLLTNREEVPGDMPLFDDKAFPTKNDQTLPEGKMKVRGSPKGFLQYVSDSSFMMDNDKAGHRSKPGIYDNHGQSRGYMSGTQKDYPAPANNVQGKGMYKHMTPGNLQPGTGAPRPIGQLNFFESCGMSRQMQTFPGTGQCKVDNQATSVVGQIGLREKLTEAKDGCVYFGTRMQAFYGLYDYPNNKHGMWHEKRTFGGHTVTIRHCVPNLNYEREGDTKLIIKEPVKDYTEPNYDLKFKDHTASGPNSTPYIGPERGFFFPTFKEVTSWKPLATWADHAGGPGKAAGFIVTMAPFCGLADNGGFPRGGVTDRGDNELWWCEQSYNGGEFAEGHVPPELVGVSKKNRLTSCLMQDAWYVEIQKYPKFKDRLFKRDDFKYDDADERVETMGIQLGRRAFGWNVPSSILLCRGNGDVRSDPKAGLPSYPVECIYQPWPKFKEEDTADYFNPFFRKAFDSVSLPIHTIFEVAPNFSNRENKLLWAYKQGSSKFASHEQFKEWAMNRDQTVASSGAGASGVRKVDTTLTVPQIKEQLMDLGVSVPKKANKPALLALLQNELDNMANDDPDDDDGDDESGDDDPGDDDDDDDPGDDPGDDDDEPGDDPIDAQDDDTQPLMDMIDIDDISKYQSFVEDRDDIDLDDYDGPMDKQLAKLPDEAYRNKTVQRPTLGGVPDGVVDLGKGGNKHFANYMSSPWSQDELYMANKMEVEDDKMSPAAVKDYKERYGSVYNLYLRSNHPTEVFDILHTFGAPHTVRTYMQEKHSRLSTDDRVILDLPLNSYTDVTLPKEVRDLFMRNMRKILMIYAEKGGGLGILKNKKLPSDDKRLGMVEGLYLRHNASQVKWPDRNSSGKPVFKRIFTQQPTNLVSYNTFRADFNTPANKNWLNTTPLPANLSVDPETTVEDWVSSPWHYEYLPFVRERSTFLEKESFCAGCKRCSRPFFEYEHNYAVLVTHPKGAHFVHQYWRQDTDHSVAPKPFHYDDFWASNQSTPWAIQAEKSSKGPSLAEDVTTDETGGFHNWPTYVFLLGVLDKPSHGKQVTVMKKTMTLTQMKAAGAPLAMEFHKRRTKFNANGKTLAWHFGTLAAGRPIHYRRYINPVFDKDAKKRPISQGVIRTANAKVAFGMTDYHLQRSSKFSNVCRDCAMCLDLVGDGFYLRNGRTFGNKPTKDRTEKYDTWWLNLKDTEVTVNGNKEKFDPWFIFLMTSGAKKPVQGNVGTNGASRQNIINALALNNPPREKELNTWLKNRKGVFYQDRAKQLQLIWPSDWEKRYDAHLEAVQKVQKETVCVMTDDSDLPVTKHRTPPEINIQKSWKISSDGNNQSAWNEMDKDQIEAATKVLDGVISWLDLNFKNSYDVVDKVNAKTQETYKVHVAKPNFVPTPYVMQGVKVGNRALRDMFSQVLNNVSGMNAYKQADGYTPKFEPGQTREEWRNFKDKDGEGLKVRTMIKYDSEKNEGEYKDKVYYQSNTSWKGDTLVNNAPDDTRLGIKDGRFVKQIRKLEQTRVFITYSLHRAVTDEYEARRVLEQMADALYLCLGNDQMLCHIILFGVKLGDMVGDALGKKQWKVIEQANKKDKWPPFYGLGTNGNSYQYDTYETHVESVTVDVGVEIGPNLHHPHFHALLTVNHYSYVQIDDRALRSMLERLFKGLDDEHDPERKMMLKDAGGGPFYWDSENAYITTKLYPSDNWQNVIAGYMRKSTTPSIMESLRARNPI